MSTINKVRKSRLLQPQLLGIVFMLILSTSFLEGFSSGRLSDSGVFSCSISAGQNFCSGTITFNIPFVTAPQVVGSFTNFLNFPSAIQQATGYASFGVDSVTLGTVNEFTWTNVPKGNTSSLFELYSNAIQARTFNRITLDTTGWTDFRITAGCLGDTLAVGAILRIEYSEDGGNTFTDLSSTTGNGDLPIGNANCAFTQAGAFVTPANNPTRSPSTTIRVVGFDPVGPPGDFLQFTSAGVGIEWHAVDILANIGNIRFCQSVLSCINESTTTSTHIRIQFPFSFTSTTTIKVAWIAT